MCVCVCAECACVVCAYGVSVHVCMLVCVSVCVVCACMCVWCVCMCVCGVGGWERLAVLRKHCACLLCEFTRCANSLIPVSSAFLTCFLSMASFPFRLQASYSSSLT